MENVVSWSVGDEAVKATNNDASECKRCAVDLGYWTDDYISLFVKRTERKTPEINRGYYARVKAMEIFVHQFLERCGKKCQIINVGCGFDTLYWRLKSSQNVIDNFIELDFSSVTARKCNAIKRNKKLLEKIYAEDGEVMIREGDLHGSGYHLLGCDLRCLPEVQRKLESCDLKNDVPTLFLAECVLVYLKPEPCDQLLKWFSSKFTKSVFVSYEQVNLNDKFGEVMLKNLEIRGCPLAGEKFCYSLETQNNRFLACGWPNVRSWGMEAVWKSFPEEDRQRVEAIEMLDERELLLQLFQHYCVTVASQGELFLDMDLYA